MQIVTANLLQDGLVVFLTPVGWVRDIARAQLFGDPACSSSGMARATQDVADNVVVEPYEIDVTVEDGTPVPVRLRERIRVSGPSTGLSASHRRGSTGAVHQTAHAA